MKNKSKFENNWFSEVCPMWDGAALSIEVDKVLYSAKSRFQQIDLYQTRTHGRMLVLDGIIQLTERDEFAYQEMMAHLPLMAHPEPARVLVVGGGDGGILREVGRHRCVAHIDFCEIDEAVIEVAKKYLPGLACGFKDPRVRVHIRDGAEFIREQQGAYDVIIVDSSDPVGPGEALFQAPFYKGIRQALRPGGIVAAQGESFFLHQECVADLIQTIQGLFPVQAYANILVPTYPGGHIGVALGSLGPDPARAARSMDPGLQSQLQYYSPEVHRAAFVLPYFARHLSEGKRGENGCA